MTPQDELSARVRGFLERHINTVAELEGLLLVRLDPARRWDAAQLGRRLYVDEGSAWEVLQALHRQGLLVRDDGGFRYAPETETLYDEVNELAGSYPRFLIPITTLIHTKPRAALRGFLDAFRLREDK
ncbi:MAG: hypothetical protein ABIT71_08845 [Vicinamibacteraceae bacterium]